MQSVVTQFMENKQMLAPNTTVLIGVSGGPDSMALLHYYCSIRKQWNLNIIAVAVDHQLRGDDSQADLLYVQEICQKWEVEFVAVSVDVKAYKREHKVGTQIAARKLRYQSFAQQMDICQADYLALGHHADDQIETMLMGFARSANTKALSGIPVTRTFHHGEIVRPFLCVTKEDIINYCEHHGIVPRIDASNQDDRYTRNYFRKHIIPIIKERNKSLPMTAQRLSESLQADEQLLQKQAYEVFLEISNFQKNNNNLSCNINRFKSYPRALQRRVYHLVLDYIYNQLPEGLSYVHEDIFFELLKGNQGNTRIDFPEGLQLERSYDTLFLSFIKENPPKDLYQQILEIPGRIELCDQAELTVNITDHMPKEDLHTWVCAIENISLPLSVRTRQAGDRMSWQGLDGSKKIKDIFIDAKIARHKRDLWPVVVDNEGKILWLIGLRKGKQVFQTKGESSYIVLKYEGRSR